MDASRENLVDPPIRPRRALIAAALVAALSCAALTACSPAGDRPTAAASSTAAVALPDSPLGEHAAWVVQVLDGEVDDVAAAASERLSPLMLSQLSAPDLATTLEPFARTAPWTVEAVDDGGEQALITVRDAEGSALDMQIVVDDDDLISGLLFLPSLVDREPAESWSELEENVEQFAADTSLTITDVSDDERVVIAEAGDADAAKPSGSMFKLYVLSAVVTAVDEGRVTWDTPLTITDDIKSLPSGELQNVASGTTVTVREAAEKMISISDNTATDLLIAAVGADAVERAFGGLGMDDAAENEPLLTTRALFQLGWGDEVARAAWAAAEQDDDTVAQRATLADLPAGLVDVPVEAVSTAVWQDGLDWFLTADDLVDAHVGLQESASSPAGGPVRDILSANSGLGEVSADWEYVAFKGGSSVGVLGGSWYVERADGRAYVLTIQGTTDDPAQIADQRLFFAQIGDALALLEQEG